MYSAKVIEQKLILAQKQLDLLPKPQQFSLQYFRLKDSLAFTSQIESKWLWTDRDAKKGEYRGLTQAEKIFIKNEQIISANNFLYWARRYPKVLFWDGHSLVRFIPYNAQKIMVSIWGDLEELGYAIVIQQLKARQLGASTATELAMAHRTQFLSNRNALVASSDPEKTREMAEMMNRAWDSQPHFMQTESISYESGQRFRVFPKFNERGEDVSSSVSLQHGNKLSGIARGKTPSDAHLSEIPDFNNPEEHIEASLFNAMHENPGMFIVLESTAKGKTGDGKWWYDTWEEAKRGWPIGESDICPIFLPYFMGTEIYPTQTWLKKTLEKKGINLQQWKPNKRTIAHSLSCERYVRETPYLSKQLGKNWKLPKAQQFWWEFKYEQAKKRDTLNKFLEEMPANDIEAFQNSGRPIFSTEFILEINDLKKPLAKYCPPDCTESNCEHHAVFMLLGHDIKEENEPLDSEIDNSRSPIHIIADYSYGKYRHEYWLVPVYHDPLKWRNRIFIWEFPRFSPQYKGTIDYEQKYATGIDCAYGLDGDKTDNTVLDVIRKGSYSKPAEQVAQIGSPNLAAVELFPYAEAIGTFYSYRTDDTNNICRQVIEIQAGGSDLQLQLMNIGWPVPYGFHEWKHYDDARPRANVRKLGWETNYANRDLLITKSIKAIKDWYLRINSPRTIKELAELQKGDTEKIEGEEHDDFVFAPFLGWFSLHVEEIYEKGMGQLGQGYQMSFKPSPKDVEAKAITIEEKRQKELDEINDGRILINLTNPVPTYEESGIIFTKA